MRIALDTRVVIGLAIAAALGLADVVGAFAPAPDVGTGTPWVATLATTVAGVVTLVGAGVVAWAASRAGARTAERAGLWVVAASRGVSLLVVAPTAFLAGFTVPLAIWTVVVVVVTVIAIVLVVFGALREDAPAG